MEFSNWSKDWHLAQEFIWDKDFSRSSTCCSNTTENSAYDWNTDWHFSYKTKEGSLMLQQCLATSAPEDIENIFVQVRPILPDLILDPFANYAVQKLVNACTVGQRVAMITDMKDDLLEFACHPRGTHVVQNLANLCSSPEEESLYISAFKGKVKEMTIHPYASHVVQKLMVNFQQKHHFIKEIRGSASALASHKHGVCVINAMLRDPVILSELMGDFLKLIQDPYGNYTMQLLIDIWKEEIAFEVICAIKGRVCQLSKQKFSSNVIETCIREEAIREPVIREHVDNVDTVVNSQFGGYVVKTAMMFATDSQNQVLMRYTVKSGIKKWSTM